MFDFGGVELVLILLIILLLFSPKKLPELARSVGKGIRTMRKAQEDLTQQIRDISSDVAAPVTEVRDDIKKNITGSLDPEAVPRNRHEAGDTRQDAGDKGLEKEEKKKGEESDDDRKD